MAHNACSCKGMDGKLYRASGEGDVKLLAQVLEEGTVDVFQEVTSAADTAFKGLLSMAILHWLAS